MLMDRSVDVAVALPSLRASRAVSSSLHTGVKEHWGVGRIERGDTEWWGRGKVWRSKTGCILVKQPGDVARHLSHRGPTTFSVVMLPTSEVEDVVGRDKAMTLAQLEPVDDRAAPFHRLVDTVMSGADRFALEVALSETIGAIANISALPAQSRPVRRAMEYIRARLADAITLDELAQHADTDKFHLCRAFRAQIGMPPHAYMTHLRVARAKELLLEGERATDVAIRVGFYDQAQLTRHFRKLVGTTPARYAKGIV
jgi:AraC-like DNA-binding protein